jgi:murein DD-endopeptidase MepM/ murein hydrolase activator NlpD
LIRAPASVSPVRMRVKLEEALGVVPIADRAREAWLALAGDEHLPRTKFDATSLPLLMPRISIPLWRGRAPVPRRVVITNLFNHAQTPISEGWSVRRTQIADFRGRDLTYDSHNGTDLAIVPGTRVVAPAAGRVVRISTEFHRGGLKLFLDHGDHLLTACAHLSRTIARVGDVVTRGQVVALSGMSGLDGLTFFPWLPPHVHWNVYLNGEYVDPFAREGTDEAAIFRGGRGVRAAKLDREGYTPSRFDRSRVDQVIQSARSAPLRSRLSAIDDAHLRACTTFLERSYFPSSFTDQGPMFEGSSARTPRLDLPFSPGDFDGIVLADER